MAKDVTDIPSWESLVTLTISASFPFHSSLYSHTWKKKYELKNNSSPGSRKIGLAQLLLSKVLRLLFGGFKSLQVVSAFQNWPAPSCIQSQAQDKIGFPSRAPSQSCLLGASPAWRPRLFTPLWLPWAANSVGPGAVNLPPNHTMLWGSV